VLLSAQRKEVSINRELDLGLEVVVDKRMIEVSFRNFISNAVKFTKPGGTITVTGSQAFDDGVVIDVADNGIGMTEEEVERLLRSDHNPSSRVGTAGEHGSGLGFELARHFVELNAGSVEIQSVPDQGTTVRVHLPGGYNPELAALAEEEQLPPE
jgi:signal transduction histidine kinase